MPRISRNRKREVKFRAKGCCEYCRSQVEFSPEEFSMDHIIPIDKGGDDEKENLAYSCQGCNNKKWTHTFAVDPLTNTKVSLFNPRLHDWNQHFSWSDDYLTIIGNTKIGRATIERLMLNRRGVVNLRRATLALDCHPPDL